MANILKIAALAAVATFAAPPALAFDCGPDRITAVARNYIALQKPGISHEQFGSHRTEISMDARRCPETGWIRIIAAGAELKWAERLEAAGEASREGLTATQFRYVELAADHILAVQSDIPERLRHDGLDLAYDEWTQIVEMGVSALTRYGDAGHVHPLVSDMPPQIGCNTVTTAMATKASNFRMISSPSSLKLLNAIADVCRPSQDKLQWSVLAQRPKAIIRQINDGTISEPGEIRSALREAFQDVTQYLDGRPAPAGLWFDSNHKELEKLLAEHKISRRIFTGSAEVSRVDWFRPENVGKDATVYSIALTLSGAWSPLAAGMIDAPADDISKARASLMRLTSEIGKEADAAGQGEPGRAMIAEALTAFQDGSVRSPETVGLPGAPDWLYKILIGLMTKKEAPSPQ
ncbi:MAG: hypothetical protein ACK4M6_06645 [Hyphomonas sp.]